MTVLRQTGIAYPAFGQGNRVQHRDDSAKVRRAPLLTPAHEADPRGVTARDRSRRACTKDVWVACVGHS